MIKAHANLAQMYVDDVRFTEYYDKDNPGAASFKGCNMDLCRKRHIGIVK